MKLLYIAGPFTAPTPDGIEQNIRAAEAWARAIANACPNVYPVVPHSLGRHLLGSGTEQYHYDGTLSLLDACDAIFLLENWRHSKGAISEANRAADAGKTTFHAGGYCVADLNAWAEVSP